MIISGFQFRQYYVCRHTCLMGTQVCLLQTAHYWANADVLFGGRIRRRGYLSKIKLSGCYRDEVRERNVIGD